MYKFFFYQVKDVMTSDPVTVEKNSTIKDVEQIFEKNDFNGLPVVDKNQRLIGMVTKLDLLKAFAFSKKVKVPQYDFIREKEIAPLMTEALHVFNPETPLTGVLQKMIETGYKSFPVVDRDRVVGIVAREDVLRGLRQAAQGYPSPSHQANH
ncbi:MAG: CBS domain-containing protein [Deltaproteobacteria bacterium]|nr:CBS domain-containing protein [Deltaproteobacteria bacterium]MBW2051055.1 CBS domain-containing protein [Deltaproteobacteria bacterium]MBW2141774.1 CBS domain-containing protein [Deltaproteobacteria bacterium]MBW2323196.1 CBS domain-containing protein [Deltaproteobacteria bacterium]